MDWKTAKVNFGRRESRSCFGARAWPVNWSLVFHTRTAPVFLVSDNYLGSAYLVPQDSRNLPKIQIGTATTSGSVYSCKQIEYQRKKLGTSTFIVVNTWSAKIDQYSVFHRQIPKLNPSSSPGVLSINIGQATGHNINTCAAKPGAGVGGAGRRRGTIHRRDAVALIHFVWGFLCGCDQADSFRFRSCLCWLNPGIERSSFRKRGKAFRCVSLIVARCCT